MIGWSEVSTKEKKTPMRKCVLLSEMHPKKNIIRVVVNKESEISADVTGKRQDRGAYAFKDVVMVEKAQQKETLEKYFRVPREQLDPVYKKIIRLIYREEVPK